MSQSPQLPPVTFHEVLTPGRFSGKTVIVTGAGSGIGKATALRVAREGGRVIAADISAARLEELVAEHPDLGFVTVTGDLATAEGAEAVAAAAGPSVDALVNNAGIMDHFQAVGEVTDAIWDRVFAVNVTSLMRLTRAVLPAMLSAGKGAVVNVASEAGLRGSCAGAAYTASKHAVIGLTKNSAVMYRKSGIRFNAVAPGAVITNIEAPFESALAGETIAPLFATNIPSTAYADELAASICFLISDDSPNVNGAILASDGGWSAI